MRICIWVFTTEEKGIASKSEVTPHLLTQAGVVANHRMDR